MIEAKQGDKLLVYVEGGLVMDVMLQTVEGFRRSVMGNRNVIIIDHDIDGVEGACKCELSADEHARHG